MSLYSERVGLLFDRGHFEKAADTLRLALASDPMDRAARLMLALCLARSGQLETARGHAADVVASHPVDTAALSTLAAVLHHQDRCEEAAAAAHRALDLCPDLDDTWALLGAIQLRLGRAGAALAAADDGLAANRWNPRCQNVRAMALLKMGQALQADAAILAALAIDPQCGLSHANRGWVRLGCGDPAGAATHFREALRLKPGLHSARAGLDAAAATPQSGRPGHG